MKLPNNEVASARTTRRRQRYDSSKAAAFFLGLLLIFPQFCLSSSAENNDDIAPSHWSPARKARFFHKVSSSFHAASRTNNVNLGRYHQNTSSDIIYGDDERIVHTGPNPLHN